MDEEAKESRWSRIGNSPRFVGSIIAIALGYFLYFQARSAWINYWVLNDGRPGMALLTEEHSHKTFRYTYTVNQREYSGHSSRNWRDDKYSNVRVGEGSVVYFSASHPWLSLLYKPDTVAQGLPVLLLVVILELMLVNTVIRPKSKWALDFSSTKR